MLDNSLKVLNIQLFGSNCKQSVCLHHGFYSIFNYNEEKNQFVCIRRQNVSLHGRGPADIITKSFFPILQKGNS